ncbi:uncharacterized protein LTR77_009368 [Saxophila tyrrhenica]|uniref:Uncharacterized protein n=1 Tax=Saxophila tyrrhenica TaxID=1690608 RepID=A0AAV9P2P7_9PEZI|nr:hypothetical protein LTR77_009368 [Saxophila tyrrhenica]
MSHANKPDLIVGIDLGQTCTGVAYNTVAHETDNIRWIQRWPGRSQANENKVPTILLYPKGHDEPSAWGFKAESQSQHVQDHSVVREWFKTLLDDDYLSRESARFPDDHYTHGNVQQWFLDYFCFLYDHVKIKLVGEVPGMAWDLANIEFLFSVPTTWSPATVEQFKVILRQAGFGGANVRHSITISLTEPEASAVYTSTAAPGIFNENDILVVCDAGGGTTDLSALKVTDSAASALSLKQLREVDVVTGDTVGSAAIDYEFEVLARDRLKDAKGLMELNIDADNAAWVMSKSSDFQNTKCEHGAPDEPPTFSVPVPGLPLDFSDPSLRIENREMMFTKDDLHDLFDHQIEKLFRLIDTQLYSLASKLPNQNVAHLILSGGLGQSAYVQQRLREQYGEGSYIPNAHGMQVRVAPDPQLSVCKGLVADRLRKLRSGQSVLGWRCCRASYGLICKELYNKSNPRHLGRRTEKDPRDGKLYVPECVFWFIEKGMPVSLDRPVVHSFRRKVDPAASSRVFTTKVVVSYLDREHLPNKLESGVEKLCEVESDLSQVDEKRFKEKNKKFWKPGRLYYQVAYQVQVIIGPADLIFELCQFRHHLPLKCVADAVVAGFDGQKLSKDNPIKVEWANTSAAPPSELPSPASTLMGDDATLDTQSISSATTGSKYSRMWSNTSHELE